MLKIGFKLLSLATIVVLAMVIVRSFAATLEIFMYGTIFGAALSSGIHLALRYGQGPLPSRWWSKH